MTRENTADVLSRGASTSEALAAARLNHRACTPPRSGHREVYDETTGRVLFRGTVYACNDWIRAGMPAQEVAR
jgi:hypothetical protein